MKKAIATLAIAVAGLTTIGIAQPASASPGDFHRCVSELSAGDIRAFTGGEITFGQLLDELGKNINSCRSQTRG